MVDKVGIINAAIGLVGGEALASVPASINDPTVPSRSRWALRLWDQVYDGSLSLWPWNDARGRYAINRHADAPAFDYASQYELDPKVLKVAGVRGCGGWIREGRFILANTEAASLKALTIDRVEPERLNALVADVVSHRLAIRMSVALSESQPKQERLKKLADDQMIEALASEGWEASSKQLMESGWLLAMQTSYAPERVASGGWMDF